MDSGLFYIFVFIFGTIVGSFLNVVIYRYNTGKGLGGRSRCLSCSVVLQARDLVPVLSHLFNKARCRSCGSRVSHQYPLVEVGTGILFVLLTSQFIEEPLLLVLYLALTSILMVITVYDFRHKIIPDELVYLFVGGSFLQPIVEGFLQGSGAQVVVGVLHSVLSGGIFFLVFWGLWRFSRGRWIGLGDAKLVLGIGALLGLTAGFTALVISFWLGAIVGLFLLLATRRHLPFIGRYFSMKSEIPFAPFLVAGTLLTLIFQLNVVPF